MLDISPIAPISMTSLQHANFYSLWVGCISYPKRRFTPEESCFSKKMDFSIEPMSSLRPTLMEWSKDLFSAPLSYTTPSSLLLMSPWWAWIHRSKAHQRSVSKDRRRRSYRIFTTAGCCTRGMWREESSSKGGSLHWERPRTSIQSSLKRSWREILKLSKKRWKTKRLTKRILLCFLHFWPAWEKRNRPRLRWSRHLWVELPPNAADRAWKTLPKPHLCKSQLWKVFWGQKPWGLSLPHTWNKLWNPRHDRKLRIANRQALFQVIDSEIDGVPFVWEWLFSAKTTVSWLLSLPKRDLPMDWDLCAQSLQTKIQKMITLSPLGPLSISPFKPFELFRKPLSSFIVEQLSKGGVDSWSITLLTSFYGARHRLSVCHWPWTLWGLYVYCLGLSRYRPWAWSCAHSTFGRRACGAGLRQNWEPWLSQNNLTRCLGASPIRKFVLPRVVAMIFIMPSYGSCRCGGLLGRSAHLDFGSGRHDLLCHQPDGHEHWIHHVVHGLIKSAFFGYFIAIFMLGGNECNGEQRV